VVSGTGSCEKIAFAKQVWITESTKPPDPWPLLARRECPSVRNGDMIRVAAAMCIMSLYCLRLLLSLELDCIYAAENATHRNGRSRFSDVLVA
jgi:hypothetical protein